MVGASVFSCWLHTEKLNGCFLTLLHDISGGAITNSLIPGGLKRMLYLQSRLCFCGLLKLAFPSLSSGKGGWEALPEGALVLPPALPSSCKTCSLLMICCVISVFFGIRNGFWNLGQFRNLSLLFPSWNLDMLSPAPNNFNSDLFFLLWFTQKSHVQKGDTE